MIHLFKISPICSWYLTRSIAFILFLQNEDKFKAWDFFAFSFLNLLKIAKEVIFLALKFLSLSCTSCRAKEFVHDRLFSKYLLTKQDMLQRNDDHHFSLKKYQEVIQVFKGCRLIYRASTYVRRMCARVHCLYLSLFEVCDPLLQFPHLHGLQRGNLKWPVK